MKHYLASVIAALGLILGSGSAHALLIGFSGNAPTLAPSGFDFELQGTIEFGDAALVAGATNVLGTGGVTVAAFGANFGPLSWGLGDLTEAAVVLDSLGSFESLSVGAIGSSGALAYFGPLSLYAIVPTTGLPIIGTAGYSGVTSVPEPPTVLLFVAGLAGLVGVLSWRRLYSMLSKRKAWGLARS